VAGSLQHVLRKWDCIPVSQGGSLLINLPTVSAAVSIETGWTDECTLSLLSATPATEEDPCSGICVSIDHDANAVTLTASAHSADCGPFTIHATVPQQLNVHAHVKSGDISIVNKLKGDALLHTQAGSIHVSTIRGETISLIADGDQAAVVVGELEGGVRAQCADFTAKMIIAQDVHIAAAKSVQVGAVYAPNAIISCPGSVDVRTSQGAVKVAGGAGRVLLGGVNGCADITCDGDVDVHFESLHAASQNKVSAFTLDSKNNIILNLSPMHADQHLSRLSAMLRNHNIHWQLTSSTPETLPLLLAGHFN
jgi:hypothetical protein